MTGRTAKADVHLAFDRLATALGKLHHADGSGSWVSGKAAIGHWQLDYAPIYGGWTIQEIVTDGGGVTCPLGSGRMPSREFVRALQFTLAALSLMEPSVSYTVTGTVTTETPTVLTIGASATTWTVTPAEVVTEPEPAPEPDDWNVFDDNLPSIPSFLEDFDITLFDEDGPVR